MEPDGLAPLDPTGRFSNRVEDYARFRPGYPAAVVAFLHSRGALRPGSRVADVGSGTGILTALFLETDHLVYGIEPNSAMRREAEKALARFSQFRSIDGTAESTTLPDSSADLVTAAQAFHWFDPERARTEFARILKPPGWVALLWNDRRADSTPFLRGYEELLRRHGTDFDKVRHRDLDSRNFESFFAGGRDSEARLINVQRLDRNGLHGRLFSSSYMPALGARGHLEAAAALDDLFAKHAHGGFVEIEYDTRVFLGKISPPKT